MEYCLSKPSALLAGFVKHYWTLNNCLLAGTEHVQRIVPNGLAELTFYLGYKPESLNSSKSLSDNILLTGQLSEYYDIRVKENLSLFSIVFQPHGLCSFFDFPVSELQNQSVSLRYLLKDTVNELETRLYEATTFENRVQIVEEFLLQRLQKSPANYHFSRIQESIRLINQSKGNINIDYLASEACFSRKQFERTFTALIGTTPKQFLRIVRFQHAIYEKSKDKRANLTQLTYQCGYYDQSHMTNDFIKLSGLTPKQYFTDCEPFSDYFQ